MDEKKVVAPAATRGRRALFVKRGMVALAAGVLAGIGAKSTERTALAANNDPILVGNSHVGTQTTQLDGSGSGGSGALRVINTSNRAITASTSSGANAIFAESTNGAAIFASSTGNAGIWGQAVNTFGLLGTSTNSTGLYGSSLGASPGLYGVSAAGPGIRGDSGLNPTTASPNGNQSPAVVGVGIGGDGVQGTSTNAVGVRGQSTSNYGVYGVSTNGTGIYGTSGPSAGVWGNSSNSIGVYGFGSTGVFGNSPSGTGVTAATTNGVALRANGRSELHGDVEVGDFDGGGTAYNLNVTGELRVNGQKMAIVRASSGEFHQFYCLESAESYFEDFGTVKLAGGVVRVAIPDDFRQFVAPERGFYIQLTPLGPCNGLYVSSKDVMGFDITESNGGKSDVEVQYRIVARRRDVSGERLTRVDPAALRPNERRVKEKMPEVPEASSSESNERRRVDVGPPPAPPIPPSR